MEALNPAPVYEPEYVQLTLAFQGAIRVRRENMAPFSPKEADLLMDADFKLYGKSYFDDAA